MKHKGSVVDYHKERIEDLMRAYRTCLAQSGHIAMDEVYAKIVLMDAQRFWVSDTRAALVVAAIERGEDILRPMRPMRREMFSEIHRRVQELRKAMPKLRTIELVTMVINEPAPKFYLTPASAKVMICQYKRKCRKEKIKKFFRLS